MFVSKHKYQKALDKIEHLEKSLAEAQNLKFVFETLTDVTRNNSDFISSLDGTLSASSVMDSLDDSVAIYVDDYYGGKVIKQEATPLTVLDKNGKATYHYTAKPPKKGHKYRYEMQ